jgi:hypothetical protein
MGERLGVRGRDGGSRWLALQPPQSGSIAELLDEARQRIVDARDEGKQPVGVLVDPATHALLVSTKRRELEHGLPLTVLGLAVESTVREPPSTHRGADHDREMAP